MPRVNGGSPGKPTVSRRSASPSDHGPYRRSISVSEIVEMRVRRSGARSSEGARRSASQARRRAAHSADRSVMAATLARAGAPVRRRAPRADGGPRGADSAPSVPARPSRLHRRAADAPRRRPRSTIGIWRVLLARTAMSQTMSAGTSRPPTTRTSPWRSRKRNISGLRTRRWRPGSGHRAGRR